MPHPLHTQTFVSCESLINVQEEKDANPQVNFLLKITWLIVSLLLLQIIANDQNLVPSFTMYLYHHCP